jgi:2-oxoglutarate dehydrogenase E2 component (dihydrolipoamide succinyltransferase)
MAEKNLSRDDVTATGRDGRVMKEDVLRALEQPRAAEPAPAATAGS